MYAVESIPYPLSPFTDDSLPSPPASPRQSNFSYTSARTMQSSETLPSKSSSAEQFRHHQIQRHPSSLCPSNSSSVSQESRTSQSQLPADVLIVPRNPSLLSISRNSFRNSIASDDPSDDFSSPSSTQFSPRRSASLSRHNRVLHMRATRGLQNTPASTCYSLPYSRNGDEEEEDIPFLEERPPLSSTARRLPKARVFVHRSKQQNERITPEFENSANNLPTLSSSAPTKPSIHQTLPNGLGKPNPSLHSLDQLPLQSSSQPPPKSERSQTDLLAPPQAPPSSQKKAVPWWIPHEEVRELTPTSSSIQLKELDEEQEAQLFEEWCDDDDGNVWQFGPRDSTESRWSKGLRHVPRFRNKRRDDEFANRFCPTSQDKLPAPTIAERLGISPIQLSPRRCPSLSRLSHGLYHRRPKSRHGDNDGRKEKSNVATSAASKTFLSKASNEYDEVEDVECQNLVHDLSPRDTSFSGRISDEQQQDFNDTEEFSSPWDVGCESPSSNSAAPPSGDAYVGFLVDERSPSTKSKHSRWPRFFRRGRHSHI